jgi:hypothetical protein
MTLYPHSQITRAKLDTYNQNTNACESCYTSSFATRSSPVITRFQFGDMLKRITSRYHADYSIQNLIDKPRELISFLGRITHRRFNRIITAQNNKEASLDYC